MCAVPVYTGLNGSSNPDDLDHCGAWLNAVHWDEDRNIVRGFYHQVSPLSMYELMDGTVKPEYNTEVVV